MPEIDFKAIGATAAAKYEKVFDLIGLQMKRTHPDQFRGTCPVCNSGGDRILVYTISKQRWCCHSKVCSPKGGRVKGGDIIYLVAHVKGIKQLEAAKLLQEHFMRPEPEKPKAKKRLKRPGNSAKPKPIVGGTDTGTIADILNL